MVLKNRNLIGICTKVPYGPALALGFMSAQLDYIIFLNLAKVIFL